MNGELVVNKPAKRPGKSTKSATSAASATPAPATAGETLAPAGPEVTSGAPVANGVNGVGH